MSVDRHAEARTELFFPSLPLRARAGGRNLGQQPAWSASDEDPHVTWKGKSLLEVALDVGHAEVVEMLCAILFDFKD